MEKRDAKGLTEAEFLAQYRPKDYPRPSVTADIIVFREADGGLEVLLIRRGNHPYLGKWALPGGFAEPTESVDETALRELEEETHLKGIPLEPVGLFSTPGRDPRTWVMSEAYVAKISEDASQVRAGDDAEDAAWFRLETQCFQEKLILRFSSQKHGAFQAILRSKTYPGIVGERTEYQMEDAGELAFDHARMLGYALKKIQRIS